VASVNCSAQPSFLPVGGTVCVGFCFVGVGWGVLFVLGLFLVKMTPAAAIFSLKLQIWLKSMC